MSTRSVVDRYYELTNKGSWEDWGDLFAPDFVMQEQMGGYIEGRDALRDLVHTLADTWAYLENVPRYVIVDGEEAAGVSHQTARTGDDKGVVVQVATYFRVVDDKIVFLANFHDTAPFASVLGG